MPPTAPADGMRDVIAPALEAVSTGVAAIAVLLLCWAVLRAAWGVAAVEAGRLAGRADSGRAARLREELGAHLITALEFLVASDIIDTIVRPSLSRLAVLGGVVAIRTILSYTLSMELERHRAPHPTPAPA